MKSDSIASVKWGFEAPHTASQLKDLAPVLLEAGFEWMEIEDPTYQTEAYQQALNDIMARYRPLLSVHCQYRHVFPASENPDIRSVSLAIIRQGIDQAARLGAGLAVMHGGKSHIDSLPPADHPARPGAVATLSAGRTRGHEQLRSVLPALAEYAASREVRLVIENLFQPWDLLCTPDEVADLLDEMAGLVGFCLDVGHANVAGFPPTVFTDTLGRHIRHLHLHGNDGQFDAHRPLSQSSHELVQSVQSAIAGTDPDVCLLIELSTFGCTADEFIADLELLAGHRRSDRC